MGNWVANRRTNKHKLTAERILRLESIPGWTWSALDANWEEGFSHLEAFAKREGHARVAQSFNTSDGYSLGQWVTVRRRGKHHLTAERIARLESLPGWAWNAWDASWEEGFSHLEAFAKREGHARVAATYKTSDGYALGSWVRTQMNRAKQDKVSAERIARLDALPGWAWEV